MFRHNCIQHVLCIVNKYHVIESGYIYPIGNVGALIVGPVSVMNAVFIFDADHFELVYSVGMGFFPSGCQKQ